MEEVNQKLTVVIDDTILKPWCSHGPTLLFRKILNGKEIKFFACSACRSREECKFYKEYNEDQIELIHNNDRNGTKALCNINYSNNISFEVSQKADPDDRWYCITCQCAYFRSQDKQNKHVSHQILHFDIKNRPISDFLFPKSNDKKEAQYFFSTETLIFYKSLFDKLNLNKILCIGAPTLHDSLIKHGINSFLLDIDDRLISFYSTNQFALYNMFNHHFFTGDHAKTSYKQFLKCSDNETFCIFTDPPFGCRTEVLVDTLKKIIDEYRIINCQPAFIVPIIWVFPYFMETYIQNLMPELSMCDYKINYTNHKKYNKTSKSRKDLGSPIRFYTNIFPSYIELPEDEYHLCRICNRFVDNQNKHCILCGVCPSKNGATYKHCKLCRLCVKPTYKHCQICKRCTQIAGHNCTKYKKEITCHLCYKKGHAESECFLLNLLRKGISVKNKNKKGNCLICLTNGHTHLRCPVKEAFST